MRPTPPVASPPPDRIDPERARKPPGGIDAERPRKPPATPSPRRTAGLLIALGLLTASFSLPVLGDPAQVSFPNYTRDNYFYIWSFWWVKQAVLTGKDLFNTDLLYFPYGTTLIFTEFIPLYALISLPVLAAAASPAVSLLALNLWTLSSFVFFGWAVYRFTRWETGSERGALAAGLILPFSAYRFHHLEHISLLWSAWMPLAAWFAGSWCLKPGGAVDGGAIRRPSAWLLAGLGACGLGMAFASYSLLIFTGFLLAGWFAISLSFDRSRLLPGAGWRMASAIAVLGCATLPGTRHWIQALAAGAAPRMPPEAALRYGPDLAGFLLPTRSLLLGGFARSLNITTHGPGGDEMFLGFVFLGLAAAGVWIAGRGRMGLWLTGIAALAVSIGPMVWLAGKSHAVPFLPYDLLMKFVPALVAARTPERYVMVFQLALAPFLALGFDRVTGGRRGRMTLIVIALVTLVELYPALGPFERITVSPLFRQLRDDPVPGAVLEFSGRTDGVMRALLNQTVHERPVVGDPLSRPSRESRSLARDLDAFRRLSGTATTPGAMADLGKAGVRYLVLEGEGMDERVRESFVDLWSRHAEIVGRDEQCVIFRIPPE